MRANSREGGYGCLWRLAVGFSLGNGRHRSKRRRAVFTAPPVRRQRSNVRVTPPEQSDLDGLDVAEHGRDGAVSITSLERGDHIGVLLAIMQPAVLGERFTLELGPGIAAADHLQDAVDADQELIARGRKEPLMKCVSNAARTRRS